MHVSDDLVDQVTVFVTTVGAGTFRDCLDSLRAQECVFTLEIIDHVAPLSAALQRMRDACRTPFFVQVDEDMSLYPHAISTLHGAIAHAGSRVAMFVGDLYDPHLDTSFPIKICRHEILRRYRVEGVEDWVAALYDGLRSDGYTVLRASSKEAPPGSKRTLGLHGARWTPPTIYERYSSLSRRYRAGGANLQWFAKYPGIFLERFLEDPSELNFFALMGVVSGALSVAGGKTREKDFRTYDRLPGFTALERFLREIKGMGANGRR